MVFKAIMNGLIKAKAMPQISPTERQALEAGTVWIDGQVFSGKPDFAKMFAEPYKIESARARFHRRPSAATVRNVRPA